MQHDKYLETHIAALIQRGEEGSAWVATTYLKSAILRRKWYTKVKELYPGKERGGN
jgi:hypothetical protein